MDITSGSDLYEGPGEVLTKIISCNNEWNEGGSTWGIEGRESEGEWLISDLQVMVGEDGEGLITEVGEEWITVVGEELIAVGEHIGRGEEECAGGGYI